MQRLKTGSVHMKLVCELIIRLSRLKTSVAVLLKCEGSQLDLKPEGLQQAFS